MENKSHSISGSISGTANLVKTKSINISGPINGTITFSSDTQTFNITTISGATELKF